ncbi:MAG TPA: thioredoxin family protein [Desulfobacterales bacterium]
MKAFRQPQFGKLEARIQSGVTLVGFESPVVDPCRDQKPIIERLARQFQGTARVMDFNVDQHRQLANRLGVTSIPTLILFKDGRELRRFVGLQSAEVLADAIQAVLG